MCRSVPFLPAGAASAETEGAKPPASGQGVWASGWADSIPIITSGQRSVKKRVTQRHSRRSSYGQVLILRPAGHLVQSVKEADWAGSRLEANARDPRYTVTCHGAL
jgi:hypothetical protein